MEKTHGKSHRAWSWRSLASFNLLFGGIILLISGVVLYIAPPGRVAGATDWHLLGLDKEQWAGVHTISGYVGLIFSIVHLVVNWKVLLNYLRDRARRVYRLKAELVAAILLTVVVVVGPILYLPPFSTVMDLGETFTEGWDTVPVLAISEEYEEGDNLETTGEGDTLETHEGGEGLSTGWGRLTVEELCAQRNISVEDGLSHLAGYGIEADAFSRIRTMSDATGYPPSEVVDMILGLELGATEAAEEATD